jgi:hypothetical protein
MLQLLKIPTWYYSIVIGEGKGGKGGKGRHYTRAGICRYREGEEGREEGHRDQEEGRWGEQDQEGRQLKELKELKECAAEKDMRVMHQIMHCVSLEPDLKESNHAFFQCLLHQIVSYIFSISAESMLKTKTPSEDSNPVESALMVEFSTVAPDVCCLCNHHHNRVRL